MAVRKTNQYYYNLPFGTHLQAARTGVRACSTLLIRLHACKRRRLYAGMTLNDLWNSCELSSDLTWLLNRYAEQGISIDTNTMIRLTSTLQNIVIEAAFPLPDSVYGYTKLSHKKRQAITRERELFRCRLVRAFFNPNGTHRV